MWNVGKRILLLNSTYFSPADVIDETLYLHSRFNKGQSSLAKGDITRRLSICSVMSCHLGFDRTGNSAIRSTDPENTTLDRANRMTRCGDMVIRNLTYNEGCIRTPFWDKGRSQGVIDRTIQNSDVGFLLQVLHCDHCPLHSHHSAAICHRMSSTIKTANGGINFGQNFGVFPLEQVRFVGVRRERTAQAN